jgi:hypothetical protein
MGLRTFRSSGETLIWGSAIAIGTLVSLRGITVWNPLAMALGSFLAILAFSLLVGSLRRARLRTLSPGEGVVQIAEGRIGYFGPRTGGFVDLAALARIDIVTDGSRAAWWLHEANGNALRIPVGATGSDGLYDMLASALEMDEEAIGAALASRLPQRFPVWVREAAGRALG